MPQESTVWGVTASPQGGVQELAAQKESRIVAGHLMPDHVHMMISRRWITQSANPSSEPCPNSRQSWPAGPCVVTEVRHGVFSIWS